MHIPPQNIHQIPTGHQTPETGAEMYEKHLRDFFHSKPLTESIKISENRTFPSFDLILLGMGTDGHTASLFPGSNFLEEKEKWVTAVEEGVGSPPVPRITLTLPVLNQAKNILFLHLRERKNEILDTILDKPEEAEKLYPAAHVKPRENLIWVVAEEGLELKYHGIALEKRLQYATTLDDGKRSSGKTIRRSMQGGINTPFRGINDFPERPLFRAAQGSQR